MKRLLVAAMVAATLVPMAQAAHAATPSYTGGCGFSTLNDTTPGGQLGGQDVWNGGIYMVVAANDGGDPAVPTPTASVTASCELLVNGVSQGTVLGPKSGTGVVADASSLTFTAAITDIVTLCDHVSINGGADVGICGDATTTQIIPQPVIDAIDMVLQAIADATAGTDPLVCSVIQPLAPIVNTVGGTVLHEDTDDCDIYLFGEKFIDFVPYGD